MLEKRNRWRRGLDMRQGLRRARPRAVEARRRGRQGEEKPQARSRCETRLEQRHEQRMVDCRDTERRGAAVLVFNQGGVRLE